MAGNEPVTSPDQHKPVNLRRLRVAAVVTIVLTLAMVFGNHQGGIEDVWIVGIAAGMGLMLIVDWVLRRNGLRS